MLLSFYLKGRKFVQTTNRILSAINQEAPQFEQVSRDYEKLSHNQKAMTQVPRYNISIAQQRLNEDLQTIDPEMFRIIKGEENRQKHGINLIASENHCSLAVLQTLSTIFQSQYSDGSPSQRFHSGTVWCDENELLCQKRALQAFRLDPTKWGVNVQVLSGAPANLYVYSGLLQPHDRLMSLDLPHGGHLSHGYRTKTRNVSAISSFYEVLPYRLNQSTGYIDYDKLEDMARLYQPQLIIAGASAYARLYDYDRMRKICDENDSYLLADMAHISGLVASNVIPSPFDQADIVTTTTHKTLRGPRGALIFYRIGEKTKDKKGQVINYDIQDKINRAVYPGHQAGPHNHTIAAISVALLQAASPQFKSYGTQVLQNAKQMAEALLKKKFDLVSGGTDNHLVLLDLRSKQTDGARLDVMLETVKIFTNKNTVPGDKSALVPSGLRLGAPAMTTRGLTESDFETIVDFVDRATIETQKIMKINGPKAKVLDFKNYVKDNAMNIPEIVKLKNDVIEFSDRFPLPGFLN